MLLRLLFPTLTALVASPGADAAPSREAPIHAARTLALVSLHAECIPDHDRPAFDRLATLPNGAIPDLLANDDPILRGVGIFLADQRQLPELLLRAPHLLDDNRPTVPTAICGPNPSQFHSQPMTVRKRFLETWLAWSGEGIKDRNEFEARFVTTGFDPWSRLHAWRLAMRRGASETPENAAAIKARIASLPDETRWLVAVASRGSAQGRRFYTEQEVRDLVLSVNAATKQAILKETAPVLSDVAERAGAHETFYHKQAKAILEGKPLPEPTIPPEFERFRRNRNLD